MIKLRAFQLLEPVQTDSPHIGAPQYYCSWPELSIAMGLRAATIHAG